ncbi:hypothetical protein MMC30_005775 [Trapelia coarctata]|nr:hypothetical protein [Trapelia coarctata]
MSSPPAPPSPSNPSAPPNPSASSKPDTSSKPDPSTLPPAALALASRLFDAARTGQMDIFQQALPAGLPANMKNEKGDSLLMLASYHSHPALARLLLAHGADANVLNDRGQSPLAGAVFKHAGASARSDQPDREGGQREVDGREKEVIEVLLEGGADPGWGAPSAMDAVGMFRMGEVWRARFEGAGGRGKMREREREGEGE